MDDREGIRRLRRFAPTRHGLRRLGKVPQFIEMNDGRPGDIQFAGEGAGAGGGEFFP